MSASSYWSGISQRRLSRRRALAGAGASAAAAALLAACGGGDGEGGSSKDASSLLTKPVDTSKQAVRGGTIKDSRTVDISSFDPHNTQSGGSTAGSVNYYHQTGACSCAWRPVTWSPRAGKSPATWQSPGNGHRTDSS